MLDKGVALQLTETLATIPEFPRLSGAIIGIAEDLASLCETEERADWLVRELRQKWDKWYGTVGMINVYRAQFPKARRPGPDEAQELGEKPPILCDKCNDNGFVQTGLETPKYRWCDCAEGQLLAKEMPDFLETLNRYGGLKKLK